MKTTVVGSIPIKPSSRVGKEDPYLECIRKAVDLQAECGIDIISDGQTRGDMIEIFARKLKGISCNGKPAIVEEIEWARPITLDDQLYAKNFLKKGMELKGILTGPYTLALSCKKKVEASYYQIMDQIAKAMRNEAKALEPVVSMLQIDEPLFSTGIPSYAKEFVEQIATSVKMPVALHICGNIEKIFENLAEFKVDILDHEFKSQPEMLEKIADYSFKQRIGYGSVQTKTSECEPVEEIKKHLERGIQLFGKEKIMVDPDCGMRKLKLKDAKIKLERMVKATREIEKEL